MHVPVEVTLLIKTVSNVIVPQALGVSWLEYVVNEETLKTKVPPE